MQQRKVGFGLNNDYDVDAAAAADAVDDDDFRCVFFNACLNRSNQNSVVIQLCAG